MPTYPDMVSWNNVRILVASAILHMPLCVTRIYGNLSTYMYSLYFHLDHAQSRTVGPPMMYAISLISFALSITVTDRVKNALGLRLTCGLGVIMYSLGFFLTYFTVQHSAWATAITFSTIGGVGEGFISASTLSYVAAWFDKKVGLATSLVLSTYGIGGAAYNQIITAYINPDNLSPDVISREISYFSQPRLLDKVPKIFLLLGTIQITVLFIGFCFLKKTPVKLDIIDNSSYQNQIEVGDLHSSNPVVNPNDERSPIRHPDTSQNRYEPIHRPNNDTDSGGEQNENETLFHVLKSESFYLIWFFCLTQSFSLEIVNTYFKSFGQVWISDDQFLAALGSVISFTTFFFGMACGQLVDSIGLKSAIIAHLSSDAVLAATWYFTARLDKWMYFLWTVVLAGLLSDHLLLLSLSALKLFGKTCYTTNYGLFLSASIIATFGGSPVITFILSTFGWIELFFTIAFVAFISLLIIVLRLRDPQSSSGNSCATTH